MSHRFRTASSGLYQDTNKVRVERRKRMPKEILVKNIDSGRIGAMKKTPFLSCFSSGIKLP
jgi:hypothetical protein